MTLEHGPGLNMALAVFVRTVPYGSERIFKQLAVLLQLLLL